MLNDAKIEPALSAEEWAYILPTTEDDGCNARVENALSCYGDCGPHQKTMAAANFVLPDDHPLKLTREDVAAIIIGVESTRRRLMFEGRDFVAGTSAIANLLSIAAKIEALLPPE